MGVTIFPRKDETAEAKHFLGSGHRTLQRHCKNSVNGYVIFICRIRNQKSNGKYVLYQQNFRVKFILCHPVSTGLKKEMDFGCATLSHAVKRLRIITQYKNLELLSWSVFLYKTIGFTKVIKPCKTYSCKTWGMVFRGNEGNPITAKWNLMCFFWESYFLFCNFIGEYLWRAHVQRSTITKTSLKSVNKGIGDETFS